MTNMSKQLFADPDPESQNNADPDPKHCFLREGHASPLISLGGDLAPPPSCAPENMFNLSSFQDNREKRENI